MVRGSGISSYPTRSQSSCSGRGAARQHAAPPAPVPVPASPSARKRRPGSGSSSEKAPAPALSSPNLGHSSAHAQPSPHRVIHNAGDQVADRLNAGDEDADSDSDDDLMQEVADGPIDVRSVIEVMIDATVTRISPVTRKLYDSHLRQMAVWCSSEDRFRHCVDAEGILKLPLESDAMIMFTEHLLQKKVPWVHAQVPGTVKHLAVKTVSNFFAAAAFTFAVRNERVPQQVAQYFSNTRKSYILKIARLKDAGLHPDSTNSIGINFTLYEHICSKLGGYVAHFKGSCYSCWRDLWLFWILLFNLLGRSFQVSKICYEMIWWQDDALVIKVPSQKGAYMSSDIHHHARTAISHTPPYTHRHPPCTTLLRKRVRLPNNECTAHTPSHRHIMQS